MPLSSTNRKLSNPSPTRNQLVERSSTLRGCEPCKSRKQICNGQRPCTHCKARQQDCVYSVVSDHPRSVFTTNTARRLSSGSACETCRRRKTKCDGGSPCSFCASSGIECINNSERRKRSVSSSSPLSSPSITNTTSTDNTSNNEAIDRIEDRLRRIEKLMTAFTPSPLSSPFTKEIHDLKRAATGFRKLSSPHLQRPSLVATRQHRHSIQSISPAPSSKEKKDNNAPNTEQQSSPSPPLSPHSAKTISQSTNAMASSMLNLSLSPSSSSTSSSSYIQPSASTPTSTFVPMKQSNEANEWKQPAPIPSLMDQLSKCTFVTTAMNYSTVHYPIYPISTAPSTPNTMGSPQ